MHKSPRNQDNIHIRSGILRQLYTCNVIFLSWVFISATYFEVNLRSDVFFIDQLCSRFPFGGKYKSKNELLSVLLCVSQLKESDKDISIQAGETRLKDTFSSIYSVMVVGHGLSDLHLSVHYCIKLQKQAQNGHADNSIKAL